MIRPLHDNILIKPLVEEEKISKKGIILSTNNDENSNTTKGVVVSLGDGLAYAKNTQVVFKVKVGDVIFFKEYSGTNIIDSDNKSYKILSYEDIVAVEESN
ncbi:co-chaperone GroES [Mycoplasmoides alvi]|uniref:co-chaperone GroES n=1 Tax=Mycoplasmoides alvi TaxID=78580 RepID=UPI00051B960F|nr:co-chaperone GroES [Mycoplasmoides alvi]